MGRLEAIAALRATGWGGVILGVINGAVPFTLIAWGEKYVDSGIAAIANATVPIFVAILAIRFLPGERVTGMRLVGVLLGLAGVGVLAGFHPEGGWWAVAGTLAVVVASLSYACSNLFTQRRFSTTAPLVTATSAVVWGAVVLLPLALFQIPDQLPSAKALGSVAALGILGTAVASIILYRMLMMYGSSRTTLVTYLLPPFALFYGVSPRRAADRERPPRPGSDPGRRRPRSRRQPYAPLARHTCGPTAPMTEPLEGHGFQLRRAARADADFLAGLATNEDIEPFMSAVSARDKASLLEEIGCRRPSRTSTGAS